jgi:hypothetical protein
VQARIEAAMVRPRLSKPWAGLARRPQGLGPALLVREGDETVLKQR